MKKAELAIQAIFYVLMGMVFIAILIFGFNKLFLVQDELDRQDLLEIKNDLETAFEYCEDPLNKGNFKTFEFNNKQFNSVCIIDEDILDPTSQYGSIEEFKIIYEAGENVVLLSSNLVLKQDGTFELLETNIIDSFSAEISYGQTGCFNYDNNKRKLEVKVSC